MHSVEACGALLRWPIIFGVSVHRFPPAVTPDELGAVVHGPIILARATGIVVGLRCVFAHTAGLQLPMVLRATGVKAEAASRSRQRPLGEHDPRPFSGPTMHVEVGDHSGWADPSQTRTTGGKDYFAMDANYWINQVPSDPRLFLTVTWLQAGLPESRTELALDHLDNYDDQILPLL